MTRGTRPRHGTWRCDIVVETVTPTPMQTGVATEVAAIPNKEQSMENSCERLRF
jgi:hypothetical protein